MPDWVKVSLSRVKSRRVRRERDTTAVAKHGLTLFRELADLANAAVQQFNESDELRSLEFEPGPPYSFTGKRPTRRERLR